MAARAVRAAALHLRRIPPTRPPIFWSAGSTSSPSWWPSASSMAWRATAWTATPTPRWTCCAPAPRVARRSNWSDKSIPNCRSCRGRATSRRSNSAPSSTVPKPTFRCSRRLAEPIGDTKYAIGFHAAGLVRDGGSLQIGIGQVGDALAQGLIVRHRDNARFHETIKRLAPGTAQRWKPGRSKTDFTG